ncbi:uncharacterized protein LOC126894135 isoform X2 [Daktulosphaira vitifoliae]|uniref:uncharacterized protein LOC126894135 isoform X2 n=1 Tax=Daktulosphaira vitifoliae TaxID=58002 RepID=UPI0021A9A743|nr:uncharacterized protein LOC126894135 isoform X2 [Daktulosphaira vitifoliae]
MKIAIILNIQVYLCMFFAFLHTEGTHNNKQNAIIINNFLRHPGWNNINDVELIKYGNNKHELKDLIFNTVVTSFNCDKCTRQAMIFLGCSYANDLDIMNFSLTKFQKHCFELLDSGDGSANDCTVTLLMKMIEIVPMAKYMKGALGAIEKYHTVSRKIVKKRRFLLNRLLTNIQEEETLLTTLRTRSYTIKDVLTTIAEILLSRHNELNKDKSFCQLKHLDFDSLWNLWIIEFNTFKQQGKFQELFIFLSDKIRNFIQTTIAKKFIELGFIFDWNTSQTFLPVQPFTSDNHYTQEAIQENDITTSILHTNDVETQEDIRQENNNCDVNDDSDVLIHYPRGQKPFNKYL